MLVNHDQITKSSTFGSVQAFSLFGGLGMSMPSLHRVYRLTDIPEFIHISGTVCVERQR